MKKHAYTQANSNISKTAIIYNATITRSIVGDFSCIADDTIIFESKISNHCKIDRRNKIDLSEIGTFTYTGQNTVIKKSSIGNFCSISWNVSIGGQNHSIESVTCHSLSNFIRWYGKSNFDIETHDNSYGGESACTLGNDVWVGANAIILRDVTIGDGAVIGAGAVVTRDVEPYTIVAGVPTKPIRKRFDDETIAALLDVQWWDWPADVIRKNIEVIYKKKVDMSVIEQLMAIKKDLE